MLSYSFQGEVYAGQNIIAKKKPYWPKKEPESG